MLCYGRKDFIQIIILKYLSRCLYSLLFIQNKRKMLWFLCVISLFYSYFFFMSNPRIVGTWYFNIHTGAYTTTRSTAVCVYSYFAFLACALLCRFFTKTEIKASSFYYDENIITTKKQRGSMEEETKIDVIVE